MQHQPILAAIDLGSNSFRLQVARVEGDQLYMLDGLREPVRLAAGLTSERKLDEAAQERALGALAKFSERLRDLPPESVRAVGTNSLRVAKNADAFLARAEQTLGFPIEVIAGIEEARLIYTGVAHAIPPSDEQNLVIDIGGGSTEFIIGKGLEPQRLESLYMGCVSFSKRYFPDLRISKSSLKAAELAARNEMQTLVADYRGQWQRAYASSGTAKALGEVLQQNGFSNGLLTREGMEGLRSHLLKTGDLNSLEQKGLRSDRIASFLGGFAIMYAAFCELGIEEMRVAESALREGVLYDLWGRFHDEDMREVTVQRFMKRYHVDFRQAERVRSMACALARGFSGGALSDEAEQQLGWAARLHEIGISVAHSGYHKHTAYILANADMPGFSRKLQTRLSMLALAQRGSLSKLQGKLEGTQDPLLALSLRLAVLLFRNRSDGMDAALSARSDGHAYTLVMEAGWLAQNPLTEAALQEDIKQWKHIGLSVELLRSE